MKRFQNLKILGRKHWTGDLVTKGKAIVLYGYGINCDYETQFALSNAGFEAERVHVNDVVAGKKKLEDFHLLAFPGGFSYGDDLGSGKAMANKIQTSRIGSDTFEAHLKKFIAEEKLVIGICNGFQMLVKLGLVPALEGKYFEQQSTLTFNESGRFEDRWIYLKGNKESPCVFTKGIEKIELPVRHGEGKFIPANPKILEEIKSKNIVVFQYADPDFNVTEEYPLCPNGSTDSIAGLCDETGRVFGMMPHPEAHLFFENHPRWTRKKECLLREGKEIPKEGQGSPLFRNAFNYVKSKLL